MNDRSVRLFAICRKYGFVTDDRLSAVYFLYNNIEVPTRVFLSCVTEEDCKELLKILQKEEK